MRRPANEVRGHPQETLTTRFFHLLIRFSRQTLLSVLWRPGLAPGTWGLREQTDEDRGPRGSHVLAGGGRGQTTKDMKANGHLKRVIAQYMKAVGTLEGKKQSGARISRNLEGSGWNFKKGNQNRRQ